MPRRTFGFVKLLASSSSYCTKWADEQHRPAGFEYRLVPDLPLPFIPILIGLRSFDHVSSRVWWQAATNKQITELQKSARILRRVLETWEDILSLSPVKYHKLTLVWKTHKEYNSSSSNNNNDNNSIVENGQNPETSPADLRRLAVTQTPVSFSHQC